MLYSTHDGGDKTGIRPGRQLSFWTVIQRRSWTYPNEGIELRGKQPLLLQKGSMAEVEVVLFLVGSERCDFRAGNNGLHLWHVK